MKNPPLFDPEKTYVDVKHGPYAGRYPIYRTMDRFRKDRPHDKVVVPWYQGEKSDWILTDDGYVVQILHTYVLGDAAKRARLTKVIRVAWNSFPY